MTAQLMEEICMSKIRIYELARELGIDNKQIIVCAQRLGLADKTSHSNSLEDSEADLIRRAMLRQAMGAPSEVRKSEAPAKPSIIQRTIGGSEVIVERRQGNVVHRRRRIIEDGGQAQASISESVEDLPQSVESQGVGSIEMSETASGLKEAGEPVAPEDSVVVPEVAEQQAEVVVEESLGQEDVAEEQVPAEQIVGEDGSGLVLGEVSKSLEEEPVVLEGESEVVTKGDIAEGESSTEEESGQNEVMAVERESVPEVKGRMIRVDLPKAIQEVKAEGPKVLGRITLPVRKPARGAGSWAADDGDDESGSSKRSRSKKREISRKDLVDYEGQAIRKGKGKAQDKRGKGEVEVAPKHEFTGPKASKRVVKVDEFITVGELARQMSLKAGEVIQKLIGLGVMATINQTIDKDTATIVAEEFEYQVESISFDEDEKIAQGDEQAGAERVSRPPVVTVMGHVDHGKTSLLDYIRRTQVADKEHGGITQHIGAYQVRLPSGKKLCLLDTPGHAAFTQMRARGAQVTDVVILIVAADDGVMPQTVEAINHAKAAKVPIVVAVNKMDKAGANPDRVKQQLVEHGLQPEEWGGDTMFFPVSALTGDGVEDLLEGLLLLAEMGELVAAVDGRAKGTVIESAQQRGRGTVVTVLVQEGTLKAGDIFIAGAEYGRVRSLRNEHGELLEEVTPSTPVEVTGFNGVPTAGDDFIVVESESVAREIAENRKERISKAERARESGPISFEEFAKRSSSVAAEELNIILKADVHGSVEAVKGAIEGLATEKVKVKVLHAAVGGITESDIQLAIASQAMVLGFGVRAEPRAIADAENAGIRVGFYRVIYELVDDVKKAMIGLLEPDTEEVALGRAEVRDTFTVPKMGVIAGCYVSEGMVKRGSLLRVVRDSRVVYEGKMSSLRRFKEDVKMVKSGYECGMGVENYNDIKVGDVFEVFELKQVAPTLQ